MAHPQIAAFARLAKENTPALRVLAGQKTRLSRTMHDIRYDAAHDEIIVTNPFARAVLVFRGGAQGEEPPVRIIQGSNTLLNSPDRVDVDTVHNEIFVPNRDSVLVFSREANGNVAPLRVIRGPQTQLRGAMGIAVDPVHNLAVVGNSGGGGYDENFNRVEGGGRSGGALLIFNRTDSGDVRPRAAIQGPRTGIGSINQMALLPSKGWIILPTATGGTTLAMEPEDPFVGIWSIQDNGDVPPRWKLGGPKSTLKKPRGVAVNPKNKELIVADMRLNSVFTFYFPELF
ncbi:MAG: hypothetical protein HY647_04210 [Acidobacteria bacterium]|nr:hypothetical protein [Acidobacteriota bacterium]